MLVTKEVFQMIIELWIIKFLITDIVCSCWSSSHIAELSISLVCWMVETRARERLLHKRSQGVVELSERLDMNGKTGASVVSARIQDQPWERVVALQNISETGCINIDTNKYCNRTSRHQWCSCCQDCELCPRMTEARDHRLRWERGWRSWCGELTWGTPGYSSPGEELQTRTWYNTILLSSYTDHWSPLTIVAWVQCWQWRSGIPELEVAEESPVSLPALLVHI